MLSHHASPITTVRRKTLIAQFLNHQLRPEISDAKSCSRLVRPVGKTIARETGRHYIKGKPIRVSSRQHRNYLEEPDEGVRVAVGQNYWKWIFALASLMNEMNSEAIKVCAKMIEWIELFFLLSPVKFILPV